MRTSALGYRLRRNCGYIDSRSAETAKLTEQGSELARRIRALGAAAILDTASHTMTIDDRLTVSLRIARYYRYPNKHKGPVWHLNRRLHLRRGLILALRLSPKNEDILDYFLMPTTEMKSVIEITGRDRSRFAVYRIAFLEGVVRSIMEAVAAANHGAPGKQQRLIGPQKAIRSTARTVPGPR